MSAPNFSDIERIDNDKTAASAVTDMLGIIARELRIANANATTSAEIMQRSLAASEAVAASATARAAYDAEVHAHNRLVMARQAAAWAREDELRGAVGELRDAVTDAAAKVSP